MAARFERFVDRSAGPDACWQWTGARDPKGYGRVALEPRDGRYPVGQANRVAWELEHGPINDPIVFVRHRCDNAACVNPSHLELGDHRANMLDMVARGRSTRGTRSASAKLNDAAVREIRRRFAEGESQPFLARRFGVSRETVRNLIQRITWRHVS